MRRRLILAAATTLVAPPARAITRWLGIASFSILADLLQQVAGEQWVVGALVGPEGDAHTHQPRPSDLARLRGATLLLRHGLGFDPWFDRLARSAGGGARLVTATAGITPRAGMGHAHGPGERGAAPDPHVWHDPRLAAACVRAIGAGLELADPSGAAQYAARTIETADRLLALDTWVREQVATVPPERRVVVTAHDAFGYLGAAYGIRFLAPQGLSTSTDPSAAAVAALIRRIRAERITAVFLETSTNPATLRRLAAEAGVTVRGRLYADSLSAPDGPAPTYEAMVRHNLGLLIPAMRGDAA